MVFSSLTFLFYFLPLVLLIYFLLPDKARNYWLFGASMGFYAWGAHRFALVLLLSILANYCFARLIEKTEQANLRKVLLIIAISLNLGVLFYNKYMNFFTANLQKLFGDSIVVTQIILPIGISFFTFQAISYIVDVYRKEVPAQKNPFYLGMYIALFPQLIAGPIVRYKTFIGQIVDRKVTLESFSLGVHRFCLGLAMKVLLANPMGLIVDRAFSLTSSPEDLSVGFSWIGGVAYCFQIFFDFAGYSSMAIGLGMMFGFTFPENFNFPLIARTSTEFWRRWHISLGQWFRDYVYFPMGGSRVSSNWKLIRNLFVVWFLTGVWHGAEWTFIWWGLGYFLLVVFEKFTNLHRRPLGTITVLYAAFNVIVIVVFRVLFRAPNIEDFKAYLGSMWGLHGNQLWDLNAALFLDNYKYLFLICAIASTPLLAKLRPWLGDKLSAVPLVDSIFILLSLGLLVLSVSSLIISSHNPFIYFNF